MRGKSSTGDSRTCRNSLTAFGNCAFVKRQLQTSSDALPVSRQDWPVPTAELTVEAWRFDRRPRALPASAGPVPAVLMLQGSGAADRNSGDFVPPGRATAPA
jgi:hypothetical protein